MNINFKQTYYDDTEAAYTADALRGKDFLAEAKARLTRIYGTENIYLTSSGTAAIELAFCALGLPRGSEVLLPSFTFPSAANVLVRAGLSPVFADINAHTMALDIDDVARRMTPNTSCVMPIHYGGSSADLNMLKDRIDDALLFEDAALSFGALYKGRPLGTVGGMGILSFHRTKNLSSDEGGMLIVNTDDAPLLSRVQTAYDNGTDKQAFLRGETDAYTWQTAGVGVAMPNICAAVLCAQLDKADAIARAHKAVCDIYQQELTDTDGITLPRVPGYNTDNHHVYHVLLRDEMARDRALRRLNDRGIGACFHYMPLHTSAFGARLGYKPADLPVTLNISRRILRLPLHANMSTDDAAYVAHKLKEAICQS